MPTTSLSINGVPYTDTQNFLAEFSRIREQHLDNVFARLEEWAELEDAGTDEYEVHPFAEPFRLPVHDWYDDSVTLRRLNNKWKAEKRGYTSKSKAVK